MSTAYDDGASLSLGPNYRKLWSSSAVSNLAHGILVVALPLIAASSLAMLYFRPYLRDADLDAAEAPVEPEPAPAPWSGPPPDVERQIALVGGPDHI